MAIPMLKESCFGCCTLRKGSLTFAWIFAVISVFLTGVVLLFCILKLVDLISDDQKYENEVYISRHMKQRVFDAFMISLSTPASVVNLIGVYKEKAGYMKPWFIYVIISLFVFTREVLLEILNTPIHHWAINTTIFCMLSLIAIGLTVYALLVEYSYYRVIRSKPSGGAALV